MLQLVTDLEDPRSPSSVQRWKHLGNIQIQRDDRGDLTEVLSGPSRLSLGGKFGNAKSSI